MTEQSSSSTGRSCEGEFEAPKHLARVSMTPTSIPRSEFQPRTIWSLTNAFTSTLKALDPIPQFKATAKLGQFWTANQRVAQ